MTDNSLREQILVYTENTLKGIEDVKQVKRKQVGDMAELEEYAQTQLPLICMTGSLPIPEPHFNTRRIITERDDFISELKVRITMWLLERVNPDTKISYYLDEMWRTFYADQEYGGLIQGLFIQPTVDTVIWDPYAGFNVELSLQYVHGIGGI